MGADRIGRRAVQLPLRPAPMTPTAARAFDGPANPSDGHPNGWQRQDPTAYLNAALRRLPGAACLGLFAGARPLRVSPWA